MTTCKSLLREARAKYNVMLNCECKRIRQGLKGEESFGHLCFS